jgi:hypothetical protein
MYHQRIDYPPAKEPPPEEPAEAEHAEGIHRDVPVEAP